MRKYVINIHLVGNNKSLSLDAIQHRKYAFESSMDRAGTGQARGGELTTNHHVYIHPFIQNVRL